ncbi:MAG: Rdx family protein [Myxococcales bacterium]|nr:Rdx family protein [Myxococcales bacterium]
MSADAPVAFEIRYCQLCGYRERAESLAAELRVRLGAEVLVAEGKLGQFDVIQGGEVVAGKGATFLRRMLIHGAPRSPSCWRRSSGISRPKRATRASCRRPTQSDPRREAQPELCGAIFQRTARFVPIEGALPRLSSASEAAAIPFTTPMATGVESRGDLAARSEMGLQQRGGAT